MMAEKGSTFTHLTNWIDDVFISYGPDTSPSFTSNLYKALYLSRLKFSHFEHGEGLQGGDQIERSQVDAIQQSKISIVVLSENYASSTRCLDELVEILECMRLEKQLVCPIFYGVAPSDVKRQRKSYAKAMAEHEDKLGDGSGKVQKWRSALSEVASLKGWHYETGYDNGYKFLNSIVNKIVEYIDKKPIIISPSCLENLVGIASRVAELIELMGAGLNDFGFVGIWGMGGIGKTTIARAVYETIQGEFEVSCFVRDVRVVSKTKGFDHLQRDILSCLNVQCDFYDVEVGKNIVQNSLCNKKVLLVLDDVSQINQLENLAGNEDWFGPGSRIIITTRDMHLLNKYGVHHIYEVERLVQNEALHLFCLKAFRSDQPEEGYLDLSKDIVNYTNGLPLALEVLGSYLYGRPVDIWASVVRKIESDLPFEIFNILKLSYEGLDFKEKDIFLDIACLFKGMNRDEVTNILKKGGKNPKTEIDVLIGRSLVTINQESNELEMHDMLQEMGRNIVIQESPNDPGKRSRLWSKEDIDLVLTKEKGTKAIQGIVLSSGYDACWSPNAFSNISDLKLLIMQGVELPFSLNCLPTSLKVLHWWRYPLKTLPLGETEHEFVGIELQFSKIEELWHGKKFLGNLKYLDLSHSWYLKRTPDLSEVPVLETLVLEECSDLAEVHPSVVKHKNLVLLNLSKCIRLKTLPGKLHTCSLRELILKECWSLEHIPEFGKCMKQLSRLSLEGAAARELPTGCSVEVPDLNLNSCKNIVCLPNTIHGLESSLKVPNASDCSNLFREEYCGTEFKLPESISRLSFLSSLDLSYCGLTEETFPHDFCRLSSLVNLNLDGNYFVSIPICIRELPKLSCLKLNSCKRLQFLPQLPSSARQLEACNCPSLSTSEFNPSSEACNIFASFSQGSAQALHVLISGSNIPSWFVHKRSGRLVSAPVPQNWPLNELMGIFLCFQLHWNDSLVGQVALLDVSNGNRSISSIKISHRAQGFHLYILYLANDGFSHEIHPDKHFELSIKDVPRDCFGVSCSAASWVRLKDIEDLN